MIDDKATRERFFCCIGAVLCAFDREATDATLQGYWWGLDDLSIEDVERSCRRALGECRRMPVPAELRELAGIARPEDAAQIAWQAVERATSLGSYRTVDFEDRLINATIRSLGGWPAILERSPEEFDKWVRKDFLATYQAFSRTGVSDEAAAPLPGLSRTGDVRRIDGTSLEWESSTVRIASNGLPSVPEVGRLESAKNGSSASGRVERLRLLSLRNVRDVDLPDFDSRAPQDL